MVWRKRGGADVRVARSVGLGAGLAAMVSGCAAPPLGPLVPVVPGPGKDLAQFQDDDLACRSYAQASVAGQAEAANSRAVGGTVLSAALGAGLGAIVGGGRGAAFGAATGVGLGTGLNAGASAGEQYGIQYRFDAAYAQCMYSRGDQVPGFPPVAAAPPADAPASYDGQGGSLVRRVQGELYRLGYLGSPPDGVAGPQTAGAIQNFQAGNGLPVDGAVTPILLEQLREIRTVAR